jgi:hypothetical protein
VIDCEKRLLQIVEWHLFEFRSDRGICRCERHWVDKGPEMQTRSASDDNPTVGALRRLHDFPTAELKVPHGVFVIRVCDINHVVSNTALHVS